MNKVLDSMDSDLQSSPSENGGTKAAFRKPSNDAAHRKYRRRSPNARSPSPDDGPNRERSSSPLRQDTAKVSDDRRRKDDERDLDRHHHGRSQYGRSGDSYRQSSRSSSHNYYPRQQDYDIVKHADEDERSKSSSRSSRHTTRRESEHERSKDNLRNVSSKYSRDKSEGSGYRSRDKERESSVEYKKNKDVENLGSRKGERPPFYDEGKRRTIISSTQRDSEEDISPPKKPKLFSDRDIEHVKDVSKFTNKVEEKQQSSSSSKQVQDSAGKVTSEQDFVKDSDIDAAKVAAIKAAELVNRNLIGTGYMSTDQKKKLLWGNKKAATTTTEEPAHRWDASLSLFPDQERQEKFKKLMGVKGELKVESSGLLQAEEEKQKELQLDLEKQYTAGLRRRDGRTVGLGL